MNRSHIDALSAHHSLPANAVQALLIWNGQTPNRLDWARFWFALTRSAGIIAIGVGSIFFIAANWQQFPVFGRFALLEILLLLACAIAWWRPAPSVIGQSALMLAMLLIAALLALFGQTYQTGADVYELFFAISGLSLFAPLCARHIAHWLLWLVIFNIALILYCVSEISLFGFLMTLNTNLGAVWIFAGLMNALVVLTSRLPGLRAYFQCANSQWLDRLALFFLVAYFTWAMLSATVFSHARFSTDNGRINDYSIDYVVTTLSYMLMVAVIVWRCFSAKRDIFPLALVAMSGIVVSTSILLRHSFNENAGGFFMLTLWVIATSTAASFMLMHYFNKWQSSGELKLDSILRDPIPSRADHE